jgi:alanine dehydrogenase
MLYITEEEVRQLLPMSECVRVMRETFEALANGAAVNQPRRRMFLPTGSVLHSMAGAVGRYFGTKFYSVNLKYGAHFYFMLFDAATAKPLALMEANHLGQIRTGAASGYATDLLARPDAHTLGVIGCGFQARSQIQAILEVRPLREVQVYSRNEARREAFAEECSKAFGLPVVAMDTAAEAVKHADIVVTATYSKDPVLDPSWIRPGTHVNAMGSNHPGRREIPPELLAAARWIVVDSIEQSKIESGDLLLAWSDKDWQTDRLVELKDAAAISREPNDITIFKSNGLGVEDVAAAALVYEKALAAGLAGTIPAPSSAGRNRATR